MTDLRIKNQFLISIAFFSIIIVIIAGSVLVVQQQTTQLSNQEEIARNIQTGVSDLAYLSSDYFLYQDQSALSQWQTEFSSLTNSFAQVSASNLEQKNLLDHVQGDAQRLNSSWNIVVAYLANAPRNESIRVLPEFQADWSIMSAQSQALIFDAQQLSQSFRTQANQLTLTSAILILTLLGMYGAYFIINYVITYRNTLNSISELQAGISVIGSGNLNYTLKAEKKDEISEISESFNEMTTNLKNVTASKTDLVKEVEERKKAEEKVQRLLETVQLERDKLSSLVNSIPDEVWFADKEKKITLANPAAIKEFNLTAVGKDDVEGIASSFEVYRGDGTPRPVEEAPPLRSLNGEVVRNEIEIVRTPASGEMRYRQVNSVPVKDNNGNVTGSVSVVRDVTEMKIAEEALTKAEQAARHRAEELEQLQIKLEEKAAEVEEYATRMEEIAEDRAKKLNDAERLAAIGATAGMVGHDIRNPLQSITSDVYIAQTELADLPEGKQKENIKESLAEIGKAVEYVNKIVQDLQDYARPLKPAQEITELTPVITSLTAKNKIPKNIRVTIKISKDANRVLADPLLAKRIFENLVTNAIQAMPEGGALAIRTYRKTNSVEIHFQDTGAGIPEDIRPKLFTPLFTTKSKGQGFGLAVVKRLTEAMKGKVTFESEPGKGTIFIINLPTEDYQLAEY